MWSVENCPHGLKQVPLPIICKAIVVALASAAMQLRANKNASIGVHIPASTCENFTAGLATEQEACCSPLLVYQCNLSVEHFNSGGSMQNTS